MQRWLYESRSTVKLVDPTIELGSQIETFELLISMFTTARVWADEHRKEHLEICRPHLYPVQFAINRQSRSRTPIVVYRTVATYAVWAKSPTKKRPPA
jgi:hypothetical protein